MYFSKWPTVSSDDISAVNPEIFQYILHLPINTLLNDVGRYKRIRQTCRVKIRQASLVE